MKRRKALLPVSEDDRRQRILNTSIGLVMISVVMLPQVPFVKWTFTHGIGIGFGSGRSALVICWTCIMLVLDVIAVLVCLFARPKHAGLIVLAPVVLLIGMFVAIPLAYMMWICIQIVLF